MDLLRANTTDLYFSCATFDNVKRLVTRELTLRRPLAPISLQKGEKLKDTIKCRIMSIVEVVTRNR